MKPTVFKIYDRWAWQCLHPKTGALHYGTYPSQQSAQRAAIEHYVMHHQNINVEEVR